ncbi:MAG: translational repressor RegA [Candidatus Pacebacteria bacterium]|jgi:hypothetical protein|nr:translational repressor RegA [Candidatus Paceibacterota bacterium]|tara:strand:- start:97 stop:525 length:429 start_codon:yes stop_codon:yes gene_type:complete
MRTQGRYDEEIVDWSPSNMVEITFAEDDDFLKIKETLTRMGVASNRDKILYQSTHILHKQGQYYIVHFKELFALDGKPTNITNVDIERRNAIINLLQEWNLLKIVQKEKLLPMGNVGQFKIISFKEKPNWQLIPKYNIGVKY